MGNNKPKVVLDIDGTLIQSISPRTLQENNETFRKYVFKCKELSNNNEEICECKNIIEWNGYLIQERPYLNEFLDFLFQKFDVGVWTAGSEDYAHMMCSEIFKRHYDNLVFIWSREKCTLFNGERVFENFKQEKLNEELIHCILITEEDFPERKKQRDYYLKDLRILWRNRELIERGWNENNTIIIEDTPENSFMCYNNIIQVSSFQDYQCQLIKKIQQHYNKKHQTNENEPPKDELLILCKFLDNNYKKLGKDTKNVFKRNWYSQVLNKKFMRSYAN
jgi:hypothetical protein